MPWSPMVYIRVPSWRCIVYVFVEVWWHMPAQLVSYTAGHCPRNPLCCAHTSLAVSHGQFTTSAVSPFPECHVVGVTQYLALAHQFLWLSNIRLSFFHVMLNSKCSVSHCLPATWQMGQQRLSYIILDLHSSQTVPRQLYPPTGWWFLVQGPGHVHEWYSQETQLYLMIWHEAGCSGLKEIALEPHRGFWE